MKLTILDIVRLYRINSVYRRSTDVHMQEGYLLYVKLRHEHNHRLSCADALSKRDVSAITAKRLTEEAGASRFTLHNLTLNHLFPFTLTQAAFNLFAIQFV